MTTPRDPFGEFARFFSAFDRPTQRPSDTIAFDIVRHRGHIDIHFELPGVDPDSIDLTVDDRELVVTAEKARDLPEDAELVRAETASGTRSRRLRLGRVLSTDALVADYVHGVLTVRLPIEQQAQPRKIAIGDGTAELTEVAA